MGSGAEAHLKREALIGGVSNAIFNGLIAWLILRGGPDLAWGGEHSFVIDLLATAFLLPLIVALIVIPLQRRKLTRGDLHPIRLSQGSRLQRVADRFPAATVKSSLLFGLVGLFVFAPIALLVIYAAGIETFSPAGYAIFKGAWAGLLAAALVVIMVLVALRGAAVDP
jgi:hypothetical protein